LVFRTSKNYLEVLKPAATILLTFIGFCAAVVAGDGHPAPDSLLVVSGIILVGSAGANGLTNYLDRDVDARMQRTRCRVLPSKQIVPPQKALFLAASLVIIGLALSVWLLPLVCFVAALIGTIAAVVWRKRATCVFPQGVLASCAPVLIGWLAIDPAFSWEVVLLCLIIAIWLPLHVWSVMIVHRDDYISAGLTFFPVSWEVKNSVKVLLGFSLMLGAASVSLYFVGDFSRLYLAVAIILSVIMICATVRLAASHASRDAWRLYKLSSFPYLGVIFLVMSLDVWLL